MVKSKTTEQMKIIKAHVFQHKYTGAQMFIFHKNSQEQAQIVLNESVPNAEDFIYLTIKEVLV